MAPDSPVRVLVADPFPMSTLGVNQVVTDTVDLRIVGSIHTARDFWLVRRLDLPFFDVLLVDVYAVGGVATLRRLVEAYPGAVVVYTDILHITAEVLASGAAGYVSKREDGDTLVAALRAVGRGETYWSPEMEACRQWYAAHGPIGRTPAQQRIWEHNTGTRWDEE